MHEIRPTGKDGSNPGIEGRWEMTIVLIIVCILFCAGVVLAIVGHLGYGVASDRVWRRRIGRHHGRRGKGRDVAA
jgi:hypothetical protein